MDKFEPLENERWVWAKTFEREIGIRESKICLCCNGKRKSAGCYIWKYKKEVA